MFTKDKMVYQTTLKPQAAQIKDLRIHEDQVLNSYKVLDKEKGIYQIPIEQAMKVMADEAYEKQKQK